MVLLPAQATTTNVSAWLAPRIGCHQLCLCWKVWDCGTEGGRGENEIKVTHSGAVASNFSLWVSEETATDLWYKYYHTAWWYQLEVHTENLDRAFDHISASCPQLSWLSVQKIKISLVNQCVCSWRTGFFFFFFVKLVQFLVLTSRKSFV